jgi:1,2-dihydroxy-3-keto-5-methylthiopentene dioxygenase
MAIVWIPSQNRRITDREEIAAFLAPHGIWHEVWPLEERVDVDASPDEILEKYAPEIEQMKERGGFTTADVINVTPETPNLDELMKKYQSEHTHAEDEVRFIIKGRGLFHIHPSEGPVFAVETEPGDLINVPKGTRHWFHLCEDRRIRAIRWFQNLAGWTPQYVDEGVHAAFAPLCWGPSQVQRQVGIASSIAP